MVKVCVLQTDNRPSLNYLLKTQEVNKKFCDILKYDYLFLEMDNNKFINTYNKNTSINTYNKNTSINIHPATKKIHIINDFLQNTNYDILVFLDSDAWIQNGYWLDDIINNLINNNEKQGCFSRDPYVMKNTFINSGSFILKNNNFIKEMYKNIIIDLDNNNKYHNLWPYDQYYISKFIFENKEKFNIFIPDILNTPIGKVLRHNWLKNKKMYDDLDRLSSDLNNNLNSDLNNNLNNSKMCFIEKDYYDDKDFPNKIQNGYEYFN
jgi:hypothetical protein